MTAPAEIPTTAAADSEPTDDSSQRRLVLKLSYTLEILRHAFHQTCASVADQGASGGPAGHAIYVGAGHIALAMHLFDPDHPISADYSAGWLRFDTRGPHAHLGPGLLAKALGRLDDIIRAGLPAGLSETLVAAISEELEQGRETLQSAADLLPEPASGQPVC